jgi:hypothetical protein
MFSEAQKKNIFVVSREKTIGGSSARVARFFWYNVPKRGKYTKWPQNIPNGDKMSGKFTERP